MELYLITGFLGAGKTTFLRQFVRCFEGQRLWLIINEFGKAGIDGALLQKVNAEIAEITNGSIFCACRLDRFEEQLRRAVAERPDVILVEASGLSDPTNVQSVLAQQELASIQYRGSVCLVDTPRLEKVLHTARVCPKQLKISSLVLLNKADIATPDQLQTAKEAVLSLNPGAVVHKTEFGAFRTEWLAEIHPLDAAAEINRPDIQLQKQMIGLPESLTEQQLNHILRMVVEDSWRVKGIVVLGGKRLLVDCVGPEIRVSETTPHAENENKLVLLAGAGMPLRKAVKQAVRWYPELIWEEKE